MFLGNFVKIRSDIFQLCCSQTNADENISHNLIYGGTIMY